MESYGSAIEDATKAIEVDPKYVKVFADNSLLDKFLTCLKQSVSMSSKCSQVDDDVQRLCKRNFYYLRWDPL